MVTADLLHHLFARFSTSPAYDDCLRPGSQILKPLDHEFGWPNAQRAGRKQKRRTRRMQAEVQSASDSINRNSELRINRDPGYGYSIFRQPELFEMNPG